VFSLRWERRGTVHRHDSHNHHQPHPALFSLSFSSNTAFKGKDIYFAAPPLITSVTTSQFPFCPSISEKYEGMMGQDSSENPFPADSHLLWFLVQYEEKTVYVSSSVPGVDIHYCGASHHPCLSVGFGISHLVGEGKGKERVIETKGETAVKMVLTDTTVESSSSSLSMLVFGGS
jgi:hypothetical protein